MFFFLTRRLERTRRQTLLQSRCELSDDDIYDEFYANVDVSKTEVSKYWHQIAEILHVNPKQLRPDDRFDELLCLPKWLAACLFDATDIDDLEYWVGLIERNKKHRNPHAVINTVDELIIHLTHADNSK